MRDQMLRWDAVNRAVGTLMEQLEVDRETASRTLMLDSVRADVTLYEAARRGLEDL